VKKIQYLKRYPQTGRRIPPLVVVSHYIFSPEEKAGAAKSQGGISSIPQHIGRNPANGQTPARRLPAGVVEY
jgi:hypothetical protein